MRILTAVAAVSLLSAGLASAQMKTPQTAAPAPIAPPPVVSSSIVQPQPPLEAARRIKRDEAIKLVKEGKAVWVDVRSKDSYDAGHIKGALSIPENELISRLKEIPPKRMIIAYCA